MGAAALPLMIATTIVSTGVSIYQSSQQKSMLARQAEARQKQLKTESATEANRIQTASKEEEIQRLRLMTDTINQNIIRGVAGGTTLEGTPGKIIESNIEDARSDLETIKLNREQALKGLELGTAQAGESIESGLQSGISAANTAMVGSVVEGVGNVASISGSGKL